MSDERRAQIPVAEQLKQLTQTVIAAELIQIAQKNEYVVSVESALPEAKIIAQGVADCLDNQRSFVRRKDSQRAPKFEGDEDVRWAKEIAWQLYPDSNMRTAGLPTAVQRKREQLVVEALTNNQPLQLDFGVLWVGKISSQLELRDLAIAQTLKGFIEILQHYQQLDPSLQAKLHLTVAVEPCLAEVMTPDLLAQYTQQLQTLIQQLSHLSENDSIAISIEPNQTRVEQNLETLVRQIQQFWIDSQAIYDEVLTAKRKESGDETLTWEKYTKSSWDFLRTSRGENVDKDYQVYVRSYLNALGENRLSKLASYQAIPAEIRAQIGWLTPNFKLALLKQVRALRSQTDPGLSDAELLSDQALVTDAITSLIQKSTTTSNHARQSSALTFAFGADLPDSPQSDVVKLKHWGNLSFNKASPWEQPLVFCRTQSQIPTPQPSDGQNHSEHSTPEYYGLSLKPAPENEVAISTTATIKIDGLEIEAPIRYLPSSWLIQTIKVCMEGNHV